MADPGNMSQMNPQGNEIFQLLSGNLGRPRKRDLPDSAYYNDPYMDRKKLYVDMWESFEGRNWFGREYMLDHLTTLGDWILNMFPIVRLDEAKAKYGIHIEGDNILFDEWHYETHVVAEKSRRNTGRILQSYRTTKSRPVVHRGEGFEMPMDFLEQESKKNDFLMYLRNMDVNLAQTWMFQILKSVISEAIIYYDERMSAKPFTRAGLNQALEAYRDAMFSLRKEGGNFERMEARAWSAANERGVRVDTVITPDRSTVDLNVVRYNNQIYGLNGDKAINKNANKIDTQGQLRTNIKNLAIVESQRFKLEGGAVDPMVHQFSFGQRIQVRDQTLEQGASYKDWSYERMAAQVIDAQTSDTFNITALDGIHYCGMFDPDTKQFTAWGREMLKGLFGDRDVSIGDALEREGILGHAAQMLASNDAAFEALSSYSAGQMGDSGEPCDWRQKNRRTKIREGIFGNGGVAKKRAVTYGSVPGAPVSGFEACAREAQDDIRGHQLQGTHIKRGVGIKDGIYPINSIAKNAPKFVFSNFAATDKDVFVLKYEALLRKMICQNIWTVPGIATNDQTLHSFLSATSTSLTDLKDMYTSDNGSNAPYDDNTLLAVIGAQVYAVDRLAYENKTDEWSDDGKAELGRWKALFSNNGRFGQAVTSLRTRSGNKNITDAINAAKTALTKSVSDTETTLNQWSTLAYASVKGTATAVRVGAGDVTFIELLLGRTKNNFPEFPAGTNFAPINAFAKEAVTVQQIGGLLKRQVGVLRYFVALWMRDARAAGTYLVDRQGARVDTHRVQHILQSEQELINRGSEDEIQAWIGSSVALGGKRARGSASAGGANAAGAAAVLRSLQFDYHALKTMYDHNIIIPLSFDAYRLDCTVLAGSNVFLQSGEETAITVVVDGDLMYERHVPSFTVKVHSRFTSNCVVRKAMNLELVPATFPVRYLRGMSRSFYDVCEDGQDYANGIRQKDIHVIVDRYGATHRNIYTDVSGQLSNDLLHRNHDKEHYTLHEIYSQMWGWKTDANPSIFSMDRFIQATNDDEAEYRDWAQTFAWQTSQMVWSKAGAYTKLLPGQGPLGTKIDTQTIRMLNGENAYNHKTGPHD